MACGLGAVILVFMLVKFEEGVSIPEEDLLKADLARLEAAEADMAQALAALRSKAADADSTIEDVSRDIDQLEQTIGDTDAERSQRQQELAGLKQTIEAIQPAKTDDVIESPNRGEETYLIGLRVEGRRIGILVDSSASMTDYRLIDIIGRKGGNDANKQAGPKWQRTTAIVEWLLARLPRSSEVSVAAFGEKATPLGGRIWSSARDQSALTAILSDVQRFVPTGATNLEAGLAHMARQNPDSLYIITDGLPTMGSSSYKSLNPFAKCSALWGGSATISGECRQKLFDHSIQRNPMGSAKINVVLLPLEGDPGAAHRYWMWVAETGGLLISPAEGWP